MAIDQDVLNHTQNLLNSEEDLNNAKAEVDDNVHQAPTVESNVLNDNKKEEIDYSSVIEEVTPKVNNVQRQPQQPSPNLNNQNLGGNKMENNAANTKATMGLSLFQAGANQGLFTSDGGVHSEYLLKVKEHLEHVIATNYKDVARSFQLPNIEVTNIARETHIGKIPYATILLSYIHNDNGKTKCFYYFFQFTHTGPEAMTVRKLRETFNENRNVLKAGNNNASTKPYILYDQAVSKKFRKIIEEHLIEHYAARLPEDAELISLQGSNISSKIIEHNVPVEKLVNQLVTIGGNRLFTDFKLRYQKGADVTVRDIVNAKNAIPNSQLILNMELNSSKSRDESVTDGCGNYLRNDFAGTMMIEPQNQIKQELATTNDTIHLCSFKGYVTGFPGEEIVPTHIPGQVQTRLRMRPHIVLTQAISASNSVRSLQTTLLAIASSGVMLKKENYMAVLKNNVGSEYNCPGAYNVICNLTNETDPKAVAPLNFMTKSFDENATLNALSEMFSLAPIMSMDIVPYTEQSGVENIFMLAAMKDNPDSERARKIIVDACHKLTDGHFPKDFILDNIFYMDAIAFPAGHFTAKNKDLDIRYLDLATILKNSKGDELLISKYIASNVSDGNMDPFFGVTECLDDIGAGDCTVISRGVRCTFTAEFVNALTRAVTQAGLSPTYNSFGVQAAGKLSIDRFSMYYKDAGITDVNFGSQRSFGPEFTTAPSFLQHYYF